MAGGLVQAVMCFVSGKDGQVIQVSAANPLPGSGGGGGGGDATAANQVTGNTRIGDVAETAPATDTASSGLNGRLQRLAQLLTAQTPLIGALTETAPATDTASSGQNGRLQRIAQRLTALIAQLPATLGIKTAALSLSIAPASDAIFRTNPTVKPAGVDKSGTATTTSGALTVAANASRISLVGQNVGAASIGFNEMAGTAAIGTAGTYTVAAGASFSVSTNRAVNFIAASGTVAVTMTET